MNTAVWAPGVRRAGFRVAIALSFLTLVVTLATSCAKPRDEVVLWAMGSEGEVVAKLVPLFERRNPGVHVRVQAIPWSAAHEKLLTAFVGGSMPDVFQAGNTWLPELAELGAIERLDGRIASSASIRREDLFPGILDTNVIGGSTWGVPWYVDTRLVFYRSDLLHDADVPEPPTTWSGWLDAMQSIRARAGTTDRFPILLPLREWQVPVMLALERGASLLRDGDRFGNFRSEPVRAAFHWYLDLFQRGFAPKGSAASSGNVYQEFAAGRFVFYVSGPWNLGEFARRLPPGLQDHWDTAPMPSSDSRFPGASVAGGASLAIARGGKHADQAWRLVEFLSEPAQQAELYRLTGDLPASRRAWTSLGLAEGPRTRAFYSQLQSVRATPKIPEWERIASQVALAAEALVRGEMTLDPELARLDREVDVILEKRRWLLDRNAPPRGPDAR